MPGPAARLEPADGGLPGLSVQTASGDWIRLHGRRDPIAEADRLIDGAFAGGEPAALMVIGLGLGYILEAIERRSATTRVVAFEPLPNGLPHMLGRRTWDAWMASGRLTLLVGPDYNGVADAWRTLPVTPPPAIVVHPVVARVAPREVAHARSLAERAVMGAASNAEARTRFAGRYLANTVINVPTICAEADAARLTGLFAKRPAIVVAAGPSLDRNLTMLRRLRDRAVLIAVDTAVRPLLSAGLEPDLIVSVDPSRANARHLMGVPDLPRSWFVAEGSIDPRVFHRFEGRTFIYRVSDHHPWPWLAAHGCDRGHLRAWGSVLTTAFDAATEAGCEPIVFAAADLAYTGGRPYCGGTIYDGDRAELPSAEARAAAVAAQIHDRPTSPEQDMRGDTVLSAPHFVQFRDWLAARASALAPRQILNATGAGILHGTHIVQVEADTLDLPAWPDAHIERPALLDRAWRSTQYGTESVAARRSLREALDRPDHSGIPLEDWVTFGGDTFTRPAILACTEFARRGLVEHAQTLQAARAPETELIMRALEDSGDPMDQLLTARRERDRARTERDTAFTSRDAAYGERDLAFNERDEARRERDTLLRAGAGLSLAAGTALVSPLTERVIVLGDVLAAAGLAEPMTEYDAAMIYRQLALADEPGQPTAYDFTATPGLSLKQRETALPVSITAAEFAAVHNLVAAFGLQRGYECATAFGVSALAAGLGFRKTGGRLVTVDAYVEEDCATPDAYRHAEASRKTAALGYRSASWILQHFGLAGTVSLRVGWSPDDIPAILDGHPGGPGPLDFVFIDAGHWDEALVKDLAVIRDRLADRYVVLVHDVHCFSESSFRFVQQQFGRGWSVIDRCRHPLGWNLSVISPLL